MSIAFRCKVNNHPALIFKLPTKSIPFNYFLKKHCDNASSQCTIKHHEVIKVPVLLSTQRGTRELVCKLCRQIPFLLQLNYSNRSRNWHVNSAAEIPLSHFVRLPSTFSNHSSRTIRHMTTEAKIPFSLPGCQTCACNFSAVVAFSEDLETSRALCNQKFFFLIQ